MVVPPLVVCLGRFPLHSLRSFRFLSLRFVVVAVRDRVNVGPSLPYSASQLVAVLYCVVHVPEIDRVASLCVRQGCVHGGCGGWAGSWGWVVGYP